MDEPVNLGLLRRDYTSTLRTTCEAFVSAANGAEQALARWPLELGEVQAPLDRRLVQMVVASQRAVRLILPPPSAAEYFGLPRSATAHAHDPDPSVRVQDPGREAWDFRPWLSEKLTHLQEHLAALLDTVEYVLNDPAYQESQDDEKTRAERVQDHASYALRASRSYAEGILSAIETMGLSVIDWRITGRPE